jgi:hypothetical protein
LAALLNQAASAEASFSEASDHIRYSAYAEAVAGSDAFGVDWSHRDLAERCKHLSSYVLNAGGIPSVQVGPERHTSVAVPDGDLVESLDASSLEHHDQGLGIRFVAAA